MRKIKLKSKIQVFVILVFLTPIQRKYIDNINHFCQTMFFICISGCIMSGVFCMTGIFCRHLFLLLFFFSNFNVKIVNVAIFP